MTGQEAIIRIEKLLLNHRHTHIVWRHFYEQHPKQEGVFANGAGSLQDQKDAIAAYDEALEALVVLAGKVPKDG